MIISPRLPLKILTLFEETNHVHQSGFGDSAVFEDIPNGWWRAILADLTILRFSEKPDLAEGDEVYIKVEKKGGN